MNPTIQAKQSVVCQRERLRKTKILRKTVVSVLLLVGLAMLLAAGTRNSRGLVEVGNALPAAVIAVTNTNDSGPGSLRDALASANDGDTIDATGVSGTILLTSGELQINHNVTINGPGTGSLAVNGNATSRVFENFASNVIISGFTITNGLPPTGDNNGGGGILNHGGLTLSGSSILSNNAGLSFPSLWAGGGINTVGGTLTVTNSVISGNTGSGGGISANGATVTVSNSTINGNMGGCDDGGGIHFSGGGTLTVMNSTISSNFGGGGGSCKVRFTGGGISCEDGMTVVTNSTISGNGGAGSNGSGVYNGGTLTVSNSTISGNGGSFGTDGDGRDDYGSFGGGVENNGNLTVTNSTISGNSANNGGAISNGGTATIGDTILNAGVSGGTISNGGTFTSLGYNLASDDGGGVLTGPGDQINTDPQLGPLQDNGGPTFTQALLPGSPAINAGNPSFTPPPRYDQRGPGFPRVVHGRIDIGSFELQRRH